MLLVFMLLLNTNDFKIGSDNEIQTRLLPNLDKTWPGLVTNDYLNRELKNKRESVIPSQTPEQVNKAVNSY
ncbi:hypothetical protein AHMF7616_00711 [Adhaeribacter pallidiroseus]|uniref:Uncharacterized protein n=2 Tax=Adhaeribacter pallidiroseus TaxID=2072847 RepID=A0A369QCQ3_9BACT|nr:hypothetical protein AHMF7616_00711 [Adhaeribacter pallidiroseus]